jgi:hypothetical protein
MKIVQRTAETSMPMGKLWRSPLTSPLRGLFSGEFYKMFSDRLLGLGQAGRLFDLSPMRFMEWGGLDV